MNKGTGNIADCLAGRTLLPRQITFEYSATFCGHSSEPLRLSDRHATQRRRKGMCDPLRVFVLELTLPCISLLAGVRKDECTTAIFLYRGYCAVVLRWIEFPKNPAGWITSNAQPLEFVADSHNELFLHVPWLNQR